MKNITTPACNQDLLKNYFEMNSQVEARLLNVLHYISHWRGYILKRIGDYDRGGWMVDGFKPDKDGNNLVVVVRNRDIREERQVVIPINYMWAAEEQIQQHEQYLWDLEQQRIEEEAKAARLRYRNDEWKMYVRLKQKFEGITITDPCPQE